MLEPQAQRRFRHVELFTAVAILIWRSIVVPPLNLWRDWLILLSLYWGFTIFARNYRTWPGMTLGLMAFLLAIYAHGQIPHALRLMELLK